MSKREILAVLALVGATVVNVWLSRLDWIPTWQLAVIWVGCYVAVVVIAWWSRWKAAYLALRGDGPDELKVRRVRLLEYHTVHLLWVRRTLLEPATEHAQIADAPRVIDKHRRQLLDLIPSVFPTSAHQEFSVPGIFVLSPAVVEQAKGMKHGEMRAKVISDLDSLLLGIHQQWLVNDGIHAPRPLAR